MAVKVERKLAAILAADVVGYSRLIGADETGTLARLKALRQELIDPTIAEHRGRIIKLMGDGALVEFASVVDAVECAVAIQRGMAERNDVARQDQRIDFRIGINLGDVVVEDEDVFGDGGQRRSPPRSVSATWRDLHRALGARPGSGQARSRPR